MSDEQESPHVCTPFYVTEGEVVCFECGAVYFYRGVYDEEELTECWNEVKRRG